MNCGDAAFHVTSHMVLTFRFVTFILSVNQKSEKTIYCSFFMYAAKNNWKRKDEGDLEKSFCICQTKFPPYKFPTEQI